MSAAAASAYNVVVLGGGTAGLVTAAAVAGLGGRVALVERAAMGGDCLNTGCVPSKALISSARLADRIRRAGEWGIAAGQPQIDLAAVLASVRESGERRSRPRTRRRDSSRSASRSSRAPRVSSRRIGSRSTEPASRGRPFRHRDGKPSARSGDPGFGRGSVLHQRERSSSSSRSRIVSSSSAEDRSAASSARPSPGWGRPSRSSSGRRSCSNARTRTSRRVCGSAWPRRASSSGPRPAPGASNARPEGCASFSTRRDPNAAGEVEERRDPRRRRPDAQRRGPRPRGRGRRVHEEGRHGRCGDADDAESHLRRGRRRGRPRLHPRGRRPRADDRPQRAASRLPREVRRVWAIPWCTYTDPEVARVGLSEKDARARGIAVRRLRRARRGGRSRGRRERVGGLREGPHGRRARTGSSARRSSRSAREI